MLEQRIEKFGLRLKLGEHFDVINPDHDERYRDYWQTYHQMGMRKGVTEEWAKLEMRRRHSLIGAMMIHKGDADGMICGTFGTTMLHLHYIDQVLGKRAGANVYAAMNFLILPERQLAMVDTHVNENPNAEQLAEITIMAAEEMSRFGLIPRAALLSHSNFGSSNSESAKKMRAALALVQQQAPDLEIDGEMHGDAALDSKLRAKRDAAVDAEGRRQPAGDAEHRRGQHRLQPAQDRGRQRHRDRAGAAGLRQAGAHPDAVGHGAPHRQHDRAVRGRCGVATLSA